jgi:tRNA(Arg) A34 adenosine deaminase TadA
MRPRVWRHGWCPALGLALLLLAGCATSPAPLVVAAAANPGGNQADAAIPAPATGAAATAQAERDEIFTLLAYAVVLKDWQSSGSPAGAAARGYNIGSVLVDPAQRHAVYWGLNSVYLTENRTQHGEVRLMTCFFERMREAGTPLSTLKGYTIYTTLEPCAMCSGMMVLTSVPRTVYGQEDPGFGKALERLKLDSSQCQGYPPYPRAVESDHAAVDAAGQLERRYDDYRRNHPDNPSITDFLATPEARQVYEAALAAFLSLEPRFAENRAVLADARDFYTCYSRVTPAAGCPDLAALHCLASGHP